MHGNSLWGQFYLNDIIGLKVSQEKYQMMRKSKINKIIGNSIEADGSNTKGFILNQELQIDGKKMTTTIANSSSSPEKITNIYELSKLKRTIVNKSSIETKTEYGYNENGALNKITSTTIDSVQKKPVTETHIWYYQPNGSPSKMIKFGNGMDTLTVELVSDSSGLIIEEYWFKKGKKIETYYYYYSNNQLTDVVRFNIKANRLIPDFVYEYNQQNQLTSMIQISFNGSAVVHWTYTYHSNGLRETETARDKAKNIIAKITYSFERQ
ncbi:MAG: hypothetical protein A2546_14840 [Sphingobacteriia bacterium RIFOXYD2_FULL_35_12]|nr:MAG: hypothetical protein A2472_10250 [Sphingobacteriia bacterium RIFOXYC2_FULL_35_18]OHC87162.1 MAG: hypothetical protein A2546_14840 [Sphingobacteriia bacterium RIFOXYD2_FULL_35_12]